MSLRRPLLPRKKLIISLPSVPKRTSPPRRFQSTSSSSSTNDKPLTRIDKILSRVPKFLRPWTNGLRNAPASNVVAFLILHELTAAVPLVGLAGLFHYADWLPTSWTEARYIRDGTEKFGRYFARKGWFGFSKREEGDVVEAALEQDAGDTKRGEVQDKTQVEEAAARRWHVSQNSSRFLVEVATAYAIVKVLLPARILVSVWASPWFARVFIERVGGGLGSFFRRGTSRAVARKTPTNKS